MCVISPTVVEVGGHPERYDSPLLLEGAVFPFPAITIFRAFPDFIRFQCHCRDAVRIYAVRVIGKPHHAPSLVRNLVSQRLFTGTVVVVRQFPEPISEKVKFTFQCIKGQDGQEV